MAFRNPIIMRLRMDNTSAVAYVNRLGGTFSLVLSDLALTLWEWALSQGFFLSAEHLSGRLNIEADWQSRHFHDSSNWKLCLEVFRALMLIRVPCAKDLFADRLNAQLPQFFSWRPDPMALASDALQQDWSNGRNYAFLLFCLIMRSLAKLRELGGELVLVSPVWPTQAWYPSLLDLSVSLPVLLPTSQNLLLGPQGQIHPLIANQTLFIPAWHDQTILARGRHLCRHFQTHLGSLAARHKRSSKSAWRKWHSWCLARESDSFRPALADITSFLSDCFNEGLSRP